MRDGQNGSAAIQRLNDRSAVDVLVIGGGNAAMCAALAARREGAEVLVLDSQYDATEYQSHVGWGHGCVDYAVSLAMKACIKKVFLFHHDPDHNDEFMDRVQAELDKARPGSVVAREGLVVRP